MPSERNAPQSAASIHGNPVADPGCVDETSSSSSDSDSWLDRLGDGAGDWRWRSKPKSPVTSVFVHAGAGYHSVANERIHLEACSDATQLAMKFLKNGATAVEAVEAAIKCFEDKEITNAGYGSNLNIDGIVECDATIVDHHGRSGACGATPNIKNPISLARLILDTSSCPLSLRRVPPNILVGAGAKDFAYEHGMPILPNDFLVSKNARDRYQRWNEDLKRAEGKPVANPIPVPPGEALRVSEYEKEPSPMDAAARGDHISAILTGTWNEGQPDSPQHGPRAPTPSPSQNRSPNSPAQESASITCDRTPVPSPLSFKSSGPSNSRTGSPLSKRARVDAGTSGKGCRLSSALSPATVTKAVKSAASPNHDSPMTMGDDEGLAGYESVHDRARATQLDGPGGKSGYFMDDDDITDTVGAIAIDMRGNMAAGSSSGGIGMKHSGRIGPAALVNIGTAVFPVDHQDVEQTSVAAVTSGTGEHMATTMASQKCAERLYYSAKRDSRNGRKLVEIDDDDALMESFIKDDFMNHPGVRNQSCTGAIGVMAVKKNKSGYYFHFAHNTDSFALASMASNEKEPRVVMSRLGESRDIARGARKIRID